jgi:hypothetical protein
MIGKYPALVTFPGCANLPLDLAQYLKCEDPVDASSVKGENSPHSRLFVMFTFLLFPH